MNKRSASDKLKAFAPQGAHIEFDSEGYVRWISMVARVGDLGTNKQYRLTLTLRILANNVDGQKTYPFQNVFFFASDIEVESLWARGLDTTLSDNPHTRAQTIEQVLAELMDEFNDWYAEKFGPSLVDNHA